MSLKELKKQCISCKETIEYGRNVFTKDGLVECNISGLCEVCFDDVTFDMYGGLTLLHPVIVGLSYDGVILAGGALRKLIDPLDVVMDYDMFVTDLGKLEQLKSDILEIKGVKKIFECPEGKLFSYCNTETGLKIQVINNGPYKCAEDLISSFDIVAGCCAYTDGLFTKHSKFISNVLHKNMDINTVEYPKATLNRIIKYTQKGYRLTRDGNSTFIESINQMKLDEVNGRFYID